MSKTAKILASLALAFTILITGGVVSAHAEEDVEGGIMPINLGPGDAPAVESAEEKHTIKKTISLLPTSQSINLEPNTVIAKEFKVTNGGDAAFRFRIYAQPYTIKDNGENDDYTYLFNTTNDYTNIYNWITFETPDGDFASTAIYELQPGEEKTIIYHITTPASIPAGGQYSMILANTINDETNTTSENTNSVYTNGCIPLLIYARNNADAKKDDKVLSYDVPSYLAGGPITASARVKNDGNVDSKISFKMAVRSIFGDDLYSRAWTFPVLPETERYVEMKWGDEENKEEEQTPPFGIFSVQFFISNQEEILEDRTTIVLIMPIYMIIPIILLLTIITTWIIIWLKKRKERKSRLIV